MSSLIYTDKNPASVYQSVYFVGGIRENCRIINGLKIEQTALTKSPLALWSRILHSTGRAPLLRQAQDGESRRTIYQRGVIPPFGLRPRVVSDPEGKGR